MAMVQSDSLAGIQRSLVPATSTRLTGRQIDGAPVYEYVRYSRRTAGQRDALLLRPNSRPPTRPAITPTRTTSSCSPTSSTVRRQLPPRRTGEWPLQHR